MFCSFKVWLASIPTILALEPSSVVVHFGQSLAFARWGPCMKFCKVDMRMGDSQPQFPKASGGWQ